MSTTPNKHTAPSKANMPIFGSYNGSQASLRLEKSNPGLRRSTPDSEALASSDEELEHVRVRGQAAQKPLNPSSRRTFSLADHPSVTRKPSMTASGTYSPSASNPTTPAADQNPWPAMSPSASAWGSASSGYPWTGSIWTHDSRKEPPSRLQEPTIKTYRSQSYSVGQMEQNSNPVQPNASTVLNDSNRARTVGQFPSLQRRTSRPGMMAAAEVGSLGRLKEDDDEEILDVTQRNVEQAREIERLEQENARLRAEQRQRTMSSTATMHIASSFRNTQIRGAVPEEADLAIDDHDDVSSLGQYNFRGPSGRRFSEQLAQYGERQPMSPADARLSRWQTTTGVGRLADIPQSRRHSFAADAPTRQGSFGSQDADSQPLYDTDGQSLAGLNDRTPVPKPISRHTLPSDDSQADIAYIKDQYAYQSEVAVYFKLDEKRRLEAEASVQQGLSYASSYGIVPFGGPGQTFLIVNFKCCRSDIFYIQEGTGLQVQVGDLVVVDADRGTDLGAVQHVNVTLEEARRYKEYYAEEHYKLLMMFSQQTKNGGMNAVNPNGPPTRQSAVGGMGPQGHGHRDGHGDPKAKMIKRLAQAHEFQALKEKEGNEAKAKRVCSSKVVEHGLNMEILDAEFQMDQKKLTFYYFADEYINFNALVTDLFKIYKTRIWMSAINPASFQTPTSSLGLTPAYPNSGMPVVMGDPGRGNNFGSPGNAMVSQYEPSRNDIRSRGGMTPSYYPTYPAPAPIGQRVGTAMNGFPANAAPPMDPFSPYQAQNFGLFNQSPPGFGLARQDPHAANANQSPNPNWVTQFQGLSMGS